VAIITDPVVATEHLWQARSTTRKELTFLNVSTDRDEQYNLEIEHSNDSKNKSFWLKLMIQPDPGDLSQ
jgi:hypothetical protein